MTYWLLNHKKLKLVCFFVTIFLSVSQVFSLDFQSDDINVLNLENTVFNNDTQIKLESDWEFYWDEFIEPGQFRNKTFIKVGTDSWTKYTSPQGKKFPSFGYAIYRLQFTIPKNTPPLSIYIPKLYSSSKLWINGKLISEIGHAGVSNSTTLHRRFSQMIPLHTNETNFEIVIQVANFYHNKGGINEALVVGPSNYLNYKKSVRIIADVLFIGCLSFIGIFFLIFFSMYWNKDKAILYFGIACVFLAYMGLSDRYAPFATIFKTASWCLLTKIEYVSLFLAGTSASLFFSVIFSDYVHQWYIKILKYGFLLLSALVIILPPPYFTQLILPFLIYMIVNIIYVVFTIMKAITGNRHDSILMLASTLLGSIVFSFHIFFFIGERGHAIIYVNFGYVAIFLLLSMLLMARFSDSFKELEIAKEVEVDQKKQLSLKSQELSKMNIELKENLRQLESSNAELDSFNHIVSHDLKAPLIAMHTLVTFIEEDLDTKINEETEQHFVLLKDRISKMNALINGLLAYSKAAKGNKGKEIFKLNDLLQELNDVVNHKNENTIIFPKRNLEIYTNRIELEHVFQNLISNAIKYNDKEKAIVTIDVEEFPKQYVFSVKDNGPGIDPQYHTKIFEMFNKLNDNDEIESTGIGLSIVKKLVSENQGTISVESKKGIGTTIKFSWKA